MWDCLYHRYQGSLDWYRYTSTDNKAGSVVQGMDLESVRMVDIMIL